MLFKSWEVLSTKESDYKNYEELPLFLNSETVAKVLGVSPSSGYELLSVSPSAGVQGFPDMFRPQMAENPKVLLYTPQRFSVIWVRFWVRSVCSTKNKKIS